MPPTNKRNRNLRQKEIEAKKAEQAAKRAQKAAEDAKKLADAFGKANKKVAEEAQKAFAAAEASAKKQKAAYEDAIKQSEELRKQVYKIGVEANEAAKENEKMGGAFGKMGKDAKTMWASVQEAAEKYYKKGQDSQAQTLLAIAETNKEVMKMDSNRARGIEISAEEIMMLETQLVSKAQILQLDEADQEIALKTNDVIKEKLRLMQREKRIADEINEEREKGLGIIDDMIVGARKLLGVQGLLIAAVTALTNMLKKGVENTKAINTQLGVGVGESARITANLALAAPLAAAAGFSGEMSEAAANAALISGNLDLAKNAAIATSDAAIAFQTGMDASQVAQLAENLTITTNLSREGASAMLGSVASLAQMNKVAPKKVLEDLASNAESMAKFTDGSAESLAKAAVQAARLGIELSKSAAIGEKLLDLESSIEAEMEASVLIGKELNYDRARQLALNNDIEGAVNEVVKQLGSEAEFNKMNAIQRQALADSIGVGVEDLASMVSKRGKADLDEDNVPQKQLKTQMDLVKQGYIMSGKSEEHLDLLSQILTAIIALGIGGKLTKGIGRAFGNMFGKMRAGARLGGMGKMGRGGRIGGALKGAARSGLGKAIGIAGVAIEGFKAFGNLKKGFFDKNVPTEERNTARGAGVGGAAGMAIGAVFGGPIGAAIGGFLGRKMGGYIGKNWGKIQKGFSKLTSAGKELGGKLFELGKDGFDAAKEKVAAFGPKVMDFGKKIFMVATPIGIATSAFKKFKEKLPAIKEGLGAAKDKFISASKQIGEKIGAGLEVAKEKVEVFRNNIKDKFGSAINTAKEKMAALGAAAKEKFQSIKTKVSEVASALPGKISAALSKAGELHKRFVESGGLLGKAKGAFNFVKELVVGKSVEGAKADGGGIHKSGTYLVGEEGPELVNLSRGSQVVPNDKLQGALAEGQFGEVNMEPLVNAIMELKTELQQIKSHTKSTARGVDGIKVGSSV